jgi:rod shape-determining protein MreC
MNRLDRPNSGWTRIALIFAILASSLLMSVNRGMAGNSTAFGTAAQDAVTPIASLFSRPIRATEGLFAGLSERSHVFETNAELKAELAVLRERQARYENLAMKVARYEAILGVDAQTDIPLRKIAARAVGETDGPFVRSLLLNVGKADGVTRGNPVLSTEGLVGHVINVGQNSTRVLRLSDLNSRIAVASVRSGATAILAGDNTARPKLAFVSQRKDWQVGDRVISSGDDGALPRGLHVGEVIKGEDGNLRVALATRGAALDWVWVSPFEAVTAPSEQEEAEEAALADAGGAP